MKRRQSYWTRVAKPNVLRWLKEANIPANSDAGKHILKFERKINTCLNMRDKGASYDTNISFMDARHDAWELMEDLTGSAMSNKGVLNAKYGKEWTDYCNTHSVVPCANVGDWLA